jgi:hypothetical protein
MEFNSSFLIHLTVPLAFKVFVHWTALKRTHIGVKELIVKVSFSRDYVNSSQHWSDYISQFQNQLSICCGRSYNKVPVGKGSKFQKWNLQINYKKSGKTLEAWGIHMKRILFCHDNFLGFNNPPEVIHIFEWWDMHEHKMLTGAPQVSSGRRVVEWKS